jgi:NodT family efflux transporter outer membrane factor (OMF) lipoprotein
MVGVDYQAPKTKAPASFGESHKGPTTKAAEPVDLTVWWKTFKDPELDSLIDRAVNNNNTLLQAEARVRQARAQLGVEWGNEFPTLNASGGASRTQVGKYVSSSSGTSAVSSAAGTVAGTTTGGTTTGGTSTTVGTTTTARRGAVRTENYQAGFDAGWEIDVFGGTRRAIESAEDDLEAQVNARRLALVTLTAEVANDYVQLRAYQAELKLTQSNLASEQDTLKLTQSRFNAGLVSDLDVAQAEASVATTAAEVPTLEIEIKQEVHAISILLGDAPMALAAELEKDNPLPPTPPEIPVGLPSELLRRRPDVRQAERLLAEQTANIGVAVANLFPKFSLTGSIGQDSSRLGLTAKSGSTLWSFGPTVSWQILDYFQLQSQVRVANAIQAQALYNYQQTVLQSFGDVEDALIAYSQDQVRSRILVEEVNANQRAVDLSVQLYQRGLGDFLNVQTAERALYTSQSDLAVSQGNVGTDLVRLYKALGGGWDEQNEEQYQKNENPTLKVVNGGDAGALKPTPSGT